MANCFIIHFLSSLCWQSSKSLTKEMQKVPSNGRSEEVEIREESLLEAAQTTLFHTPASGHYEQDPRSTRLSHTTIVEEAVQFWRNRSSFLEALGSVD